MATITPQITAAFGEPIKQYPGQTQVSRAVKVLAPGKHFSGLTPAEQKIDYSVTAMEFRERYPFERHAKAWGAAHTGPGIRFISDTDAIDDPDNKGFWTTLALWNRWRDTTYKDDREAEKQYLDQLPAAAASPAPAAEQQAPAGAPIKEHFTLKETGMHTVGGNGKMAGQSLKCSFWGCKKEGCARGLQKPIKQIGSGTGDLFSHLDSCQPALALRLRAASSHSPVRIGDDGEEVGACDLNPSSYTIPCPPLYSPRRCSTRRSPVTRTPTRTPPRPAPPLTISHPLAACVLAQYCLYEFNELLPHHIRFVQRCYRGFQHFYEARADTGLLEYVQGYDKRASLPCELTCQKILEVRPPPPLEACPVDCVVQLAVPSTPPPRRALSPTREA
jgi:hypothetical protein